MTGSEKWEEYRIEICTDCLMLIANGDIGDYGDASDWAVDMGDPNVHLYNWLNDDAENNPNTRLAAMIEENWPHDEGWTVVPDCGENCDEGFSSSPCDSCGIRLGGTRHHAVAMRKVSVDANSS